jgi:hypothetical protein
MDRRRQEGKTGIDRAGVGLGLGLGLGLRLVLGLGLVCPCSLVCVCPPHLATFLLAGYWGVIQPWRNSFASLPVCLGVRRETVRLGKARLGTATARPSEEGGNHGGNNTREERRQKPAQEEKGTNKAHRHRLGDWLYCTRRTLHQGGAKQVEIHDATRHDTTRGENKTKTG